ncbi:MAG TPA: MFS transporter, partial [Opitutaceae bacterium]|nr:MFS transporter [Opitutaceae bacterium]
MTHASTNQASQPKPYVALSYPTYRKYLIGSFAANLGRQMISVAVTWEIYQWTNSATALGLVGLLNVIPLLACSLPAGHLADAVDRKRIIAWSMISSAIISIGLAIISWIHRDIPNLPALAWSNHVLEKVASVFERHADPASLHFSEPALPIFYLLLFILGIIRMTSWPARSTIVPLLLPPEALSNAITWNSSAFEIATMAGPALGGFLLAFIGFPWVYLLDAGLSLGFLILLRRVTYSTRPKPSTDKRSLKGMLAGAEFIWRKRVILGASSLDLFATVLGGAVALLPIYADRILHVGPIGLGWLRAAPSLGAFSMAMWLAHRPPLKRPGVILLWSVAGFGFAVIVFGFSSSFLLSLVALYFTGVF